MMQTEKRDGFITMGLRGKIVFGFCGLILASLLASGGFIYWQNMQLTRSHNIELVQGELEETTVRILSRLHAARDNLLTLRGVPPVEAMMRARAAGGIDPLSGDDMNQWAQRLQKIFVAFLSHGSAFEKLRYFDEHGQELVRVDVIHGEVHITPKKALQNKFNRHYFQQASSLKAGEVYIGDMILSREHGRISEPNVAIMHLAVPVFDAAHQLSGLLVANLLGEHLMGVIPADKHGMHNYLFDQQGYFLLHPLPAKRFAHELRQDYTVADIFPKLLPALQTEKRYVGSYQTQDNGSQVRLFEKIYFDPVHQQRYWVLLRSIPERLLISQLDGTANMMLWLGFIITALVLILVSWVATQKIIQPIRLLVTAAEGLQQGDLSIRLPVEQVQDEFRTLYQMVNAFVEKQKHAHEELQSEVEERTAELCNIMDSMADGLITINALGIVQSVNRMTEQVFVFDSHEIVGNGISMLIPELINMNYDNLIQTSHHQGRQGVYQREAVGLRKNGNSFPVDLSITRVNSGKQRTSYIAIVRDISKLKQAADNLTAKNQELEIRASYDKSYAEGMAVISATYEREKALADMLSILARNHAFPVSALYLLDVQHESMVCVASHGACKSVKQQVRTDEGLLGQIAREGAMLVVDDLDKENGLRIDAGILSFTPVALVLSPILFKGKVLGVLELLTSQPLLDMDRYFIERLSIQLGVAFNNFGQYLHLQEITEQLQQQSDEIQQKNDELEAASRMKSEFLANMSHELRTPLNAIIGFSELIKDGAIGAVNDEQFDFVSEIHASGQHLLALINEILDLSKIEAGKMELNLCDVIVADIMENSLSIISEQALKHGVSLQTDISDEVGCCSLDMRKVKQILYNLLSNAVKFTPEGGAVSMQAKVVSSKDSPSCCKLDALPNARFLEISVTDTGIGIAEEDQQRIFLPFEQVDGSLTRRYEGTGLGLILVKAMVELHGGSIAVASEPDKGSTFTLWLPYIEAEIETLMQSNTATTVELEAGEQRLALIVEDDYVSAELMRRRLEKFNFRTQRVATAEGAVYWLESNKADLIVLDIMLPLSNGWDFLESLNSAKHSNATPVIIASAVAEDHMQEALSYGITAILQKPVDELELTEALAGLGFVDAEVIV